MEPLKIFANVGPSKFSEETLLRLGNRDRRTITGRSPRRRAATSLRCCGLVLAQGTSEPPKSVWLLHPADSSARTIGRVVRGLSRSLLEHVGQSGHRVTCAVDPLALRSSSRTDLRRRLASGCTPPGHIVVVTTRGQQLCTCSQDTYGGTKSVEFHQFLTADQLFCSQQ